MTRWHAMPPAPQPAAGTPLTPRAYYADPVVRARMLESCGGSTSSPPTAVYVALMGRGPDGVLTWDHPLRLPAEHLSAGWALGEDVSRSLWDRRNLLFLFELDYLNVDRPAEPFLHPAEVLLRMEPAYRAAATFFRRHGLDLQPIVSGRGYHFVGQVPLDDPLVDRLAANAPDVPDWHATWAARMPRGLDGDLPPRQARAAEGLNLLLEYAAHRVLVQAHRSSPIPVMLNGTIVGQGPRGRECVSIDFSHAGDPLDVRHVRTTFSTYRWHQLRPDLFGPEAASLPALAIVPRTSRSLMPVLEAGHDLATARRLARRRSARLPIVSTGIARLLDAYRGSRLRAFHEAFFAGWREAAQRPAPGPPSGLPPCVSAALDQPNDRLLKPEHLQHLVRALLARGWTAPAIAALVRASYEADHAWGDRWRWMHPAARAAFDVRVFAGLLETGGDSLTDFNCVSAQEKNLCPLGGCAYDLRQDRDRLAARLAS